MNIVRIFLLMTMTLLFSLPMAGAANTVEEQRAQAAQIIKALETKANQQEFRNIPLPGVAKGLKEAAAIYKKLLETVNDAYSGQDLDNYLFCAIGNSYSDRDNSSSDYDVYAEAVSSYKLHKDNTAYLLVLWKSAKETPELLPLLFPEYYPTQNEKTDTPVNTERDFNKYSLLKLGEQILLLGQGNTTPQDYSYFLMEYGYFWVNLPSELPPFEASSYYGYQHLLTPLNISQITTNTPLFDFSEDTFKILDAAGEPLVYGTPTSWNAAKNNGERINFLFAEAQRINPDTELEIKLYQTLCIKEAFSPRPAIITSQELLDFRFLENYLTQEQRKNYQIKNNGKEFFSLLPTLALDETLIPQGEKSIKVKLPESLDYIKKLEEIVNAEVSTQGDQKSSLKFEAAEALIDELINRMNYSEALKGITHVLSQLPSPSKKEKQKTDDLHKKLTILQEQISGNKVFFPNTGLAKTENRFTSGTDIQLPILYRNTQKLTLSIRKINTDYFLKKAEQSAPPKDAYFDRNEFLNSFDLAKSEEIKTLLLSPESKPTPILADKDSQVNYSLSPESEHRDTFDYITLPKLDSGYYLIKGTAEGCSVSCDKIIYVGDLNLTAFPMKDKLTLQLTNYSSGHPIKEASIKITEIEAQKKKGEIKLSHRVLSEKTDAQGFFALPLKGMPENSERFFLVTANVNGEIVYYLTGSSDQSDIDRSLAKNNEGCAVIITDREVYRPGQTVHWQAWLGKSDFVTGGKVLANVPVKVDFAELASPFTGKTDQNGIVSGSFILPEQAKLNRYFITLNADDVASSYKSFSIEEYKKPDFEVTIKSNKPAFIFGEDGTITVEARYYSGEPVTQGKVVLRSRGYSRRGNDNNQKFFNKTLSLNEEGKATLSFNISEPSNTPGSENDYYWLEATVSDDSQRQITGNLTFSVYSLPFNPSLSLDTNYGRAGEKMSAQVSLKSIASEPVASTGEATLYYLPEGISIPLKREKIVSWSISTNSKGNATVSYIPPSGGYFLLETVFPTHLEKNPKATTEIIFPVLPAKDQTDKLVVKNDILKIYTEKNKYKAGETAKILIISPEGSSQTELKTNLFYKNEKVYSVPTPRIFTEYELPVTEESAPNLLISASTLSNGKYFTDQDTLYIFRGEHKLTLSAEVMPKDGAAETIKSKLPAFAPKSEAKVKVQVLDSAGKPLHRTPVAISVYDKALDVFAKTGSSYFNDAPFWDKVKSDLSPSDIKGTPSSSEMSLLSDRWITEFVERVYQRENDPLSLENGNLFNSEKNQKIYRAKLHQAMIPLMGQFAAWANPDLTNGILPNEPPTSAEIKRHIHYFPGNMRMTRSSIDDVSERLRKKMGTDYRDRLLTSPLTEAFGNKLFRTLIRGGYASEGISSSAIKYRKAAGPPPDAVSIKDIQAIRKNFSDLMKWSGSLITDDQGMVELPLTMPDNLTTWKARAWSVDKSLNSGECSAEFVTTQNFIAQLHTTRFLVAQDKSLATAVLRNNTDMPQSVQVSLDIKGDSLALDTKATPAMQSVIVPAKGTTSVNWEVTALQQGNALLTLKAQGAHVSDASEESLPVTIRGAYNSESLSLNLLPNQESASLEFTIPAEIKPDLTKAYVSVSPGVAPALLKALPYLSSYPYGCVEQTMNRFVPSVIVANTFRDLKIDPAKLLKNSLPSPEGINPLKDKETLEKQIREGLMRLASSQNPRHEGGGWSWFPGSSTDPYITALIVEGITRAFQNDTDQSSVKNMLETAIGGLVDYEKGQLSKLEDKESGNECSTGSLDVFIRLVLSRHKKDNPEMLSFLLRDRKNFSLYTLTQLGLILRAEGEKKVLNSILSNLKTMVVLDKKNQTAHLNLPHARNWWSWDNDSIETQASYLRLLTATAPKGETTRGLARWLVLNRENSFYWKSTRDTALVIEALCDYIKASDEGTKPLLLEVLIDGKPALTLDYNPEKLAEFKSDLLLTQESLPPGKHTLQLQRKSGDKSTPVYLAAGLRYFSTAQQLKASGTDLTVTREYARVIRTTGANGESETKWEPLRDKQELKSGDILAVTLKITAQNDYQYLMLRDPKPAGCEPYNLVSGFRNTTEELSDTNNGRMSVRHIIRFGFYTELADRETRIFIPTLPKGEQVISYKLRVERPGIYTALPAEVEAMYAPILRGNSADSLIKIQLPPTTPKVPEVKPLAEPPITTGDETAREAFEQGVRARLGWIEEQNHPLAFRWMKKSADGGYSPALVKLAQWTAEQKNNLDHRKETLALQKQAWQRLQTQVNSTDPEVQAALASLYLEGEETAHELGIDTLPLVKRKETGMAYMKKAIELFKEAAAQGSGKAAYRLGKLHLGEGIHYSPRLALGFFEQGAKTGYAPALYEAALLTQDKEKKKNYLTQAAKAKMIPAAEALSLLCFSDKGTDGQIEKSSLEAGLAYLHQAAEGGSVNAQSCLAGLYNRGIHVPKDEDKAEFWKAKTRDGHTAEAREEEVSSSLLAELMGDESSSQEKISPISALLPPAPLPTTLPERAESDRLTEGELIKAWAQGDIKAFQELAHRPTSSHTFPSLSQKEEYLPLEKRAREGDTRSAFSLAQGLLQSPFSSDKNLGKAWLQLLVAQRHPLAMERLATLLTPQQPEEALTLLISLAERNSEFALQRLQDIFGKSGMGAELNPARALAYKAQEEALYPLEDLLKLVQRDAAKADPTAILAFLEKLDKKAPTDKRAQAKKEIKKLIQQAETAIQKKKSAQAKN